LEAVISHGLVSGNYSGFAIISIDAVPNHREMLLSCLPQGKTHQIAKKFFHYAVGKTLHVQFLHYAAFL
jgi:hypothetical protein